MSGLQPISGYVVDPRVAAEVVSPPYDALTPAERQQHVSEHPRSFLAVLPDAEYTTGHELEQASRRLDELIAEGVYIQRPAPFVAVYQLQAGDHVQTGLVAGVPAAWARSGRIRAHDATRPARVRQIIHFLDEVGIASSPVSLAYTDHDGLRAAIAAVTQRTPQIELDDGEVAQRLWLVDEPAELLAAGDGVGPLYITDGHHRTAATAEHALRRGMGGGLLLAVLFPASELRLADFHRIVNQPEMRADELAGELAASGWDVEELDQPREPRGPGEATLVADTGVWRLTMPPPDRDEGPMPELDVTRVHREVLARVLGIEDVRSHPGLRFVPGDRGIGALKEELAGSDGLAFALHPPEMDELMAVADAGGVMPPKSTYFTPKVRSGLLLRFIA